ncbi:MAG: hypothetical protein COB14_08970 [Alphaproteobacteria bacterium]|nr:MAG: hypothetical protein COB14_08970 [Alphaproteobacteria bacterium]
MRISLLFSLLTMFFVGVTFAPVQAETVLFFSPTRIDVTDQQPVQEIRVTNMSSIARSYTLSIENLIMSEAGQTMRVDNFDYSAKRMLRFVPRKFDLKPGEKQIIRIMARFPQDTADGEYHAHIEFLEDLSRREELNKDVPSDNRAHMKAQISYATAIPVIISKGEIKTEVSMSNLILGKDKKERPEISLDLARSGNGQGNIFLEADYIAPDGSETKAAVRRTIYVYRELNLRHHRVVLELLDYKDLKSGGSVRVKLYNRDVSEQDPVDTVLVAVP